MTYDTNILKIKTFVSSLLPVLTSNGNKITITHVGHAVTSNLSFPDTYYVPNSALNLIFVAQLSDLGLTTMFSSSLLFDSGSVNGTDS